MAAAPVYNPYVGFTYGFALGLATAAWMEPYWGGAYYHPGYWGAIPAAPSASANVYGHWGAPTYSGTRSWYAGGGVAGTTPAAATTTSAPARRATTTPAGSTTPGPATPRAATTAPSTPPPAAPATSRAAATTTSTPASARPAPACRAPAPAAAPTTAPARRPPGPQGDAHVGGGSTYNAKTGKTNTWGTASVGNNHYADVNGNVYKNTGDGWQQHSSSGWSSASGDTSWADRESQARSTGDDRWGGFSGADHSWGGGGFGGGGFGGGRFGGGGFGGGGFGGRFRRGCRGEAQAC